MGLFLASELVQVVDKHFDLGRGRPFLHADPVDDRVLLHVLLFLFYIRLFKINRKRNVAPGAVHSRAGIERIDIILRALAAEFVMTARPDCFFCWFITDATDEDILTSLSMFLEDQIRMIRNLAHLHDETENVGIIIEHNTPAHICVELPGGVGHDATREVSFNLPEKFIMDDHTKQVSYRLRQGTSKWTRTYRLGGSSIDDVWSFFTRLSIILSVIRRSFCRASFLAVGLFRSVTAIILTTTQIYLEYSSGHTRVEDFLVEDRNVTKPTARRSEVEMRRLVMRSHTCACSECISSPYPGTSAAPGMGIACRSNRQMDEFRET